MENNGEYIKIGKNRLHVYRTGTKDKPVLIFMAGSATVAPVYDFKVLYSKLMKL